VGCRLLLRRRGIVPPAYTVVALERGRGDILPRERRRGRTARYLIFCQNAPRAMTKKAGEVWGGGAGSSGTISCIAACGACGTSSTEWLLGEGVSVSVVRHYLSRCGNKGGGGVAFTRRAPQARRRCTAFFAGTAWRSLGPSGPW